MFLIICSITLIGVSTASIFGTRPLDCQISLWSEWSEPYGFGDISRERHILRYDVNGGAPCPTNLKEINSTGKLPSLRVTAVSMVNNFFLGKGIIKKRQVVKLGYFRDLLLIMDSSGSVARSSFETAKSQIAELVSLMCPPYDPFQKDRHHAAMLEYSKHVNVVFNFDDHENTTEVKQGIMSAVYQGGGTCTDLAFRHAKEMFSVDHGMRTDEYVKKEVLILSDGRSNCAGDAIQAAKELVGTAEVFGLIIGSYTEDGQREMAKYVSEPTAEHLFAIKSIDDLNLLLCQIKVSLDEKNICAPFDLDKK